MGGVIEKIKPVKFDWNKNNVNKNWEKHRVDYRECEEIFLKGQLKILYDIKHSQKEKRYIAFGQTNKDRRLYIVFTIRNKNIRVISARDQSRRERNFYEKS